MKTTLLILIALAIGSPCFASATGLAAPVSNVAAQCGPGYHFDHSRAGNEMTQGLISYERQVQRVLEPDTENVHSALTCSIH